jgi:hypothetical protein
MDKLAIANEMRVFDNKDRDFYNSLTEEERKKFSNFLMIRWGSSVNGSRDLQEFYLISTNQRLNKHFFAVNKHPQLQWLMATTVSPDMGTMRHNWIAQKKKEPGAGNNIKKQLAELFPNMKSDEIDLLAELTPKKELDNYLLSMGREKSK